MSSRIISDFILIKIFHSWTINGSNEIKRIPWDKWKWEYNIPKLAECKNGYSKKKVHSNTFLYQETKISTNLNLHHMELDKDKQMELKVVECLKTFYDL